MLFPAMTGSGELTSVTTISACAVVPTSVLAVALLLVVLGSLTEEYAVTVLVMMVPLATAAPTFTINEKLAAVFPGMFRSVQTMLPLAPLTGVTQFHAAGAVREMNVVLAGTASTMVALSAALGPLLVTTWV